MLLIVGGKSPEAAQRLVGTTRLGVSGHGSGVPSARILGSRPREDDGAAIPPSGIGRLIALDHVKSAGSRCVPAPRVEQYLDRSGG
jgi:hypothetical protein